MEYKEKEKKLKESKALIAAAFWFCLGIVCVSDKFIYQPLQDPKGYNPILLIMGVFVVVISIIMTIRNLMTLVKIKSGNPWFFLLSNNHFWCTYDNLFVIFFVNKSSFKLLNYFSFHFLIIYWHYRNWFMKNRIWF